MSAILNHHTPLWICSDSIRQCWQSQGKSDRIETVKREEVEGQRSMEFKITKTFKAGPKDCELIDRIGNKMKHASTLEHLNYNFTLTISRACLQELARHRMASLSVKSSRYTLKELNREKVFAIQYYQGYDDIDQEIFNKYLVSTGDNDVDLASFRALIELKDLIKRGISPDKAKYCMPESYKTTLSWTINARSLQNFLALRSSKAALWEIRDLARDIYDALPEDHKYLYTDHIDLKDENGK